MTGLWIGAIIGGLSAIVYNLAKALIRDRL